MTSQYQDDFVSLCGSHPSDLLASNTRFICRPAIGDGSLRGVMQVARRDTPCAWRGIRIRAAELGRQLVRDARQSQACRILMSIPGIGAITATSRSRRERISYWCPARRRNRQADNTGIV